MNYSHANRVIATAIAKVTSPIRFPGLLDSDLEYILPAICPLPEFHFVSSSVFPLTPMDKSNKQFAQNKRNNVFDVLKRLLNNKFSLTAKDESIRRCNIAAYCNLTGNIDTTEIGQSLLKIKERHLTRFIPWGPANFHINCVMKENDNGEELSGVLLQNNTGVVHVLCFSHITLAS